MRRSFEGFVTVADSAEIERVKVLPAATQAGRVSRLRLALQNGDVVWLPGLLPSRASQLGPLAGLRQAGWRTHVRPAERDGALGCYAWADRPSEDARRVRT